MFERVWGNKAHFVLRVAAFGAAATMAFSPVPARVAAVTQAAGIESGFSIAAEAAEAYFKKPSRNYSSIVDALKSIGADSSYSYRKRIADCNGISGYSGTAKQNEKMRSLLYQGKLKKPGSGGTSTSNTASAKISLSVPTYRQYDGAWKNVKIGTKTIGAVGCTTCCIAMIYSYHTGTRLTPDRAIKKLSYDNNSVYWSSVQRMGYTVTSPYNCSINSNILDKIYSQLKKGRPVIVGGKGGSGQHWVVVTGFSGGSTRNAANFRIIDPNSSSRTTLQQFLSYKPTVYRLVY